MMWVVLIGILMAYFLGFLIYACYNSFRNKTQGRRNSSSSTARIEHPSSGSTLSADLRPDGTIVSSTLIPRTGNNGVCAQQQNHQSHHHHHPWNWRCNNNHLNSDSTLNLTGPPNCLYYDDIVTLRNSDLPQSALTAQREQQLRQIKLEINELSRRLGIGQLYRERQLYLQSGNGRRTPHTNRTTTTSSSSTNAYNYRPIPQRDEDPLSTSRDTFTTSSTSPETPLVRIRSSRRNRNTNMNNSQNPGGESTRRQIRPGRQRYCRRRQHVVIMMEDSTSHSHLINDDEDGSSSSDDSSSLDDTTTTTFSNSNCLPHTATNSCSSSISVDVDVDVDGDDGEGLIHDSVSSSPATPVPGAGATGLGLVQTFTLGGVSSGESGRQQGNRGGGGGSRRNEIFHQRQRRLRLIRMEIEDLTLQLSSLSEDRSDHNAGGCSISSSDLEGLVFDVDQDTDEEEDGPGCHLSTSPSFPYLGELPSYDESIIVDFDDTPPPSYDQCTNLLISNSTLSTMSSSNLGRNNAHTQTGGSGHQQDLQNQEEIARMVAFYSSMTCQEEKDVNSRQGSR